MSQQFPEREFLIEVFIVTEICALPARDMPPLPPRTGFLFGFLLLLCVFRRPPALTGRRLLLLHHRGCRLRAPLFAVGGGIGGGGGVVVVGAVRAADLGGGKTYAHDMI